MTSLALLARSAAAADPAHSSTSNATVAGIIMVLFAALAVEGSTYGDLLKN